jgi:predicted DNA-binding WGR domain protein
MSAMHLSRIDPPHNMRRFHRLDMQPDLFGGFAVVKDGGRTGARGRRVGESHATEARGDAAMQPQAEREQQRGYAEHTSSIAHEVGG